LDCACLRSLHPRSAGGIRRIQESARWCSINTSVLKLIEWRWGLAPLTPRDASTDVNNLAYALNFSQPDATVPSLPVPQVPLIAAPCLQTLGSGILSSGGTATPTANWEELGKQAATLGFPIPSAL